MTTRHLKQLRTWRSTAADKGSEWGVRIARLNEARLRALQDDNMQVVLDALEAADNMLSQTKNRPGVHARVRAALHRLDPTTKENKP